ncbi:MAG: YcxB family protein [Lachnoanaerobaculum sp.]|nr:YcxB family protein [uncultured Lachnoanaerobaculum sp.]MDU6629087.1 YcxB family protein [Lachnoanaerobaculum sp.]
MNKIKIDMQLNAKDIWLFSMYHSNRGFLLIFNVLFTIVMYYYMITSWNKIDTPRKIMFVLLANMFLIIQPAMLYLKSAKQARSESIRAGLSLEMNEEGIVVSSKGESIDFKWENGFRSMIVPGIIIIYVDAVRGYLLPDRYTKEKKEKIVAVLKEKTRVSLL